MPQFTFDLTAVTSVTIEAADEAAARDAVAEYVEIGLSPDDNELESYNDAQFSEGNEDTEIVSCTGWTIEGDLDLDEGAD